MSQRCQEPKWPALSVISSAPAGDMWEDRSDGTRLLQPKQESQEILHIRGRLSVCVWHHADPEENQRVQTDAHSDRQAELLASAQFFIATIGSFETNSFTALTVAAVAASS
jgi:hypothetical protein